MNIRNQKRRDWFRILRDLMAQGVSLGQVGSACGRSKQAVRHWADGGEPKDSDARIVLALYRKHCPEQFAKHMQQINPGTTEVLEVVYVAPNRAIRGRPRPKAVRTTRTVAIDQAELFEEVLP